MGLLVARRASIVVGLHISLANIEEAAPTLVLTFYVCYVIIKSDLI